MRRSRYSIKTLDPPPTCRATRNDGKHGQQFEHGGTNPTWEGDPGRGNCAAKHSSYDYRIREYHTTAAGGAKGAYQQPKKISNGATLIYLYNSLACQGDFLYTIRDYAAVGGS